jgi:hypothetical protein
MIGWLASKGLGLQIVALIGLIALPALTARTRWALAFALAPVLLYPVSAINSPKLFSTINVDPLVAIYLLANVAWIHYARRRTTTASAIGLTSLLFIVGISLLESAYSGNGTLSHSITTVIFWVSGFLLGTVLADDPSQFATLGLCSIPLAGLSLWQAATGSNPYNRLVGSLHFASIETYEGLQRSTSTFGHPLVAGATLTILAYAATIGQRRYGYAVALFVFLGAVVTVSRSALIGAAVIFLVAAIQTSSRRSVIVMLGVLIVAVFSAATVFPRFAASLEGRFVSHTDNEVARTAGPQRLLHSVASDPVNMALGQGIGTTTRELSASGGVGGVNTYDDQFIDTSFDIGILPVVLAICAFVVSILRATPKHRSLFLPVVVGSIAMLLFFDGLAWPSYSVLFWMMFGALTSQKRVTANS